MDEMYRRVIGLIGEKKFNLIQEKTICIIGLGGVGGTLFESLFRSGFTHFVLIDFDVVEETNLNRQILFNRKDLGKEKVVCAKNKALSINPNLDITIINEKINGSNINSFLDNYDIDFIVDAVDDIDAKKVIVKYSLQNNIDSICALGSANKFNSSLIEITSLDKTSEDPLARKLRNELRKEKIDISKINVAYTKEKVVVKNRKELNSTIFVPSTMGIMMGEFIFNHYIKN